MAYKNLTQTIFGRQLKTFFIVIIPIYLLGIFMSLWGVQTVKQEIEASMLSQVQFYLTDMENEIKGMKMLQYDGLSDENLNRLAILSEVISLYERQQSMLQLQSRLITIRNSSTYIEDVTAHILPIDKTISANQGVIDLDGVFVNSMRAKEHHTGAQLLEESAAFFLTTYDEKFHRTQSQMFTIVIHIDRSRLVEKLAPIYLDEASNVMIVYDFDDFNEVDYSNTSVELPADVFLSLLNQGRSHGTLTTRYLGERFFVAYAHSEYLNMTLVKYMPERLVLMPLRIIYTWFWVFTATALVIFIIYSVSTHKYIHEPLSNLVNGFKAVQSGDMSVSIKHHLDDEFGYIYQRFNDMVHQIKMLIDQVYNQKIMTQRAELKQLQSQINPHFLYNSFFLINTMARIQDDNLIPFTKYLGAYFRFVTKNNSDIIPLKDEVEHAKVYGDIQKMRFAKRLEMCYETLPSGYDNIMVPRLIIQPLIENAFEHGVEKKQNGVLKVGYETLPDQLKIIIEDNGNPISDEALNDMNHKLMTSEIGDELSGLYNVHLRVRMLYGDCFGLSVFRSTLGGMKVILCIPKITEN